MSQVINIQILSIKSLKYLLGPEIPLLAMSPRKKNRMEGKVLTMAILVRHIPLPNALHIVFQSLPF
jgi:hypothetical protein